MMTNYIQIQRDQMKSHVAILHELAMPYARKGKFVAASFGENPETRQKIMPMVMHFNVGDIDGMFEWIVDLSGEPHRNIYIPMALFRDDLPPKNKGGEKDVIAVFGLTPDFDDAHASDYANRLPLSPDYVLETSSGRFQTFYFFNQGIEPARAKLAAEQLQNYCNCDSASADISHVWRVAGSLNYPNWTKVHEDGRSPVPQLVRIVKAYNGVPTNFDMLEAVLTKTNESQTLLSIVPQQTILDRNILLPAHLKNCDRIQVSLGELPTQRPYSPEYETEIRAALNCIPADDYKLWIKIGMAIHSLNWGETGLRVWDWWSRKSKKYDDKALNFTEPPKSLLDKWKTFNSNDGEGVNDGTIYYYAKMARLTNGAVGCDYEQPNNTIFFDLICVADFSDQELQTREWVVDGYIPHKEVVLLSGPGGSGKTLLAQHAATVMAANFYRNNQSLSFLGQKTHGHSVLAYFCEDDRAELHRRQEAINCALGINYKELKHFHMKSMIGKDAAIMLFRESRGILTTFYNQIIADAKQVKASVIILDNIAQMFAGNENNRAEVTQFVNLLHQLTQELHVAIILIGHPSKQQGSEYSGSTAWEACVRSRLYFGRHEPTSEQKGNPAYDELRVLRKGKANYSTIGDEIVVRWVKGAFQLIAGKVTDIGAKLQNAETEKQVCDKFLKLLDRLSGQGRTASHSPQAKNYAPKIMAELTDNGGYTTTQFRIAMERLFNEQKIEANVPLGTRKTNRGKQYGIARKQVAQAT